MENPLKHRPASDQTELFRQILMTLLKRSYDQTAAIDSLSKEVSKLSKVESDSIIPKGKPQQITTAVALIIFALTILALILKGCGYQW